ncbi:MAG TPA: polysaccharide deacetylase family protein [Bryobacteraceae bacterium]|nr:polysaccharide deacetylase family protein [Bryobacteraceae bacterium]
MESILHHGKMLILHAADALSITGRVGESSWRSQRIAVLCYHGVSLRDEHLWNSSLYMDQDTFRGRMEWLRDHSYHVLPLAEALALLDAGKLPARSVVLTFDDGFYDFYERALPILQEFHFPATLYLTTYYCDHPYPIANLIVRYLLWRGRGKVVDEARAKFGTVLDLRTPQGVAAAEAAMLGLVALRSLDEQGRNAVAASLAEMLQIDYDEILRARMLQPMNPSEVAEAGVAGIDIQLHTHRHRTPEDEDLFLREIRDNRASITLFTGQNPAHFCYPSGNARPEFAGWLEKECVQSAVTCENGLVARDTNRYFLPRLLDTSHCTIMEFEGEVTGLIPLLRAVAHPRTRGQTTTRRIIRSRPAWI